jgi:hypothetical protein
MADSRDNFVTRALEFTGVGESTDEELYDNGALEPEDWVSESGGLIDIVKQHVNSQFHNNLFSELQKAGFPVDDPDNLTDEQKSMRDYLGRSSEPIRADNAKMAEKRTDAYETSASYKN